MAGASSQVFGDLLPPSAIEGPTPLHRQTEQQDRRFSTLHRCHRCPSPTHLARASPPSPHSTMRCIAFTPCTAPQRSCARLRTQAAAERQHAPPPTCSSRAAHDQPGPRPQQQQQPQPQQLSRRAALALSAGLLALGQSRRASAFSPPPPGERRERGARRSPLCVALLVNPALLTSLLTTSIHPPPPQGTATTRTSWTATPSSTPRTGARSRPRGTTSSTATPSASRTPSSSTSPPPPPPSLRASRTSAPPPPRPRRCCPATSTSS